MVEYGKKFYSDLRDVSGNTYSINLNKLNYSGSTTEIIGYSTDPALLTYRGGKDQIEDVIFPSEFSFSFLANPGDDYNDLLESNYKDYNLEVIKYSNQEHDLVAFDDYSNYGTGQTWSITGDSSFYNYDFNTDFDGWFNSAAGGGTPSTGGTTTNWVWSSDHGGSLKNTTTNSFGAKMLRLSTLHIPTGQFAVKIKYQIPSVPHSTALKMNFLIRTSAGTQLFNDQITGTGTGTEQEHTFFITGDMSTADHFLITVGSTSFSAGDVIYINDISIIENINASVNLSGNQVSKYLRADLGDHEMHNGDSVFYNIRYTVTPSGTTGAHKLYLNFHSASGAVVNTHLISDQISGGTFNPFNPYSSITVTTDVQYISLSVACTAGHAFNFNIDAHNTTIRTTNKDYPNLYWTGWLHPENISSRVISGTSYFIDIQATDGLLDLQEIEFPYTLYLTTGLTSVLQLVKFALNETGIELPFKSQINTTEASITGSTLLTKLFANPTRMVKYDNGRITFIKCYDAIQYLLEPLNCQLYQSNGYWTIIERNEIASPQITYSWSGFTVGGGSVYDRTIRIDDYLVSLGSDELSKIEPIKYQETTFYNLNSGSYVPNYTINGAFTENISGWFNGDLGTEFCDISWDSGNTHNDFKGSLKVYAVKPTHDPMTARKAFYGNTFNLNASSGSTVTVGFSVNLANVIFTGTTKTKLPKVRVSLIEDEGLGVFTEVDSVVKDMASGFTRSFLISLRYQNTNLHFLEFYIEPTQGSHYNTFTVFFDNVYVFRNNDASLTFDQLYRSNVEPATTAVKVNENKIYFADSTYQTDAGALMNIHSGLTTSWTAYSASTNNANVPLVTLYNYNKLKLNRRFHDYIRITLKSQPIINFYNLLKKSSRRYAICSYSYSIVNNRLDLELAEHLHDDFNSYTELVKLSSIDGNPLNG